MSFWGAFGEPKSTKTRQKADPDIGWRFGRKKSILLDLPGGMRGALGNLLEGDKNRAGQELGKGSGKETRTGQELVELEGLSSTPCPPAEAGGGGSLRAFRQATLTNSLKTPW